MHLLYIPIFPANGFPGYFMYQLIPFIYNISDAIRYFCFFNKVSKYVLKAIPVKLWSIEHNTALSSIIFSCRISHFILYCCCPLNHCTGVLLGRQPSSPASKSLLVCWPHPNDFLNCSVPIRAYKVKLVLVFGAEALRACLVFSELIGVEWCDITLHSVATSVSVPAWQPNISWEVTC